jgi:hypothetical protein
VGNVLGQSAPTFWLSGSTSQYAEHLICSVTLKTVDLTRDGFNIKYMFSFSLNYTT